ncbi:MAG: carbohydrate ABC transporter permease [Eubacteriales bacterium]|nr:carbohydrate ABC transporter permease [Eubacteriales bacterium]
MKYTEKNRDIFASHKIESPGRMVFHFFNAALLIFLGLICFFPFWYEVCISFSSNRAVLAKEVSILPVEFTLEAYAYVLERLPFWKSLLVTVERVAIGLPISMLLMTLAAYPLSKDKSKFRFRSFYVWFFFITMLFNGGMIPSYLLIVQLGLLDSVWALILPGAFNVFNMLLLLSFFRNIPAGLEDAARVDGAGHLRTLLSIFLPISKPVLATVALFTLVGSWNSWFDGMIYMKTDHYPLQTYLRTIVYSYDFGNMSLSDQMRLAQMSPKGIKAAQMTIGALPILLVYPLLQKYFVSGITLGSVKE